MPGTQDHITLNLVSPLHALIVTVDELENKSLQQDNQNTIFFLSGRISGFDQELTHFLAMREVIEDWKGDQYKSEEARKLAHDRDSIDLPKLRDSLINGLKEGLRTGHIIFRGSSHSLTVQTGKTPDDALRSEMATFWPTLYHKFDRVPVRITNDQRAITDILAGATNLTSDVKQLKLYDKSGKIDMHSPILDATRIHLTNEQNAKRRVIGKDLIDSFEIPPYGWDPNAVRVGVAALVRAGAVKVLINKKPYTDPADKELVDVIRVSRNFSKIELELEEIEIAPEVLTETRTFLIQLAKRRSIDETPAALSETTEELAKSILSKAENVKLWASGSGMPLSSDFEEGNETWDKVLTLSNPIHRVREVHISRAELDSGFKAIEEHAEFQSKHGTQYTELANFTKQIEAVEHLIDLESSTRTLLDEYRAAASAAEFTDKERWKRLQSLKAQSFLEVTQMLGDWRSEAHQILQNALDRLPAELVGKNLDAGLAVELAKPLNDLKDGLDNVTVPAQVAALRSRATQVMNHLASRIAELSKPADKPEPKIRKLRISSLAIVPRVANEAEWEDLKGKLDQQVKKILADGYNVEFE